MKKGMKSTKAPSGKSKGGMYRASGQARTSGGGSSSKDGYKAHKAPKG